MLASDVGAFDSTLMGVSPCAVYAAWGVTLQSAYPTFKELCRECSADEWHDQKTGGCRQRAEIAVRASSKSLNMTLVKTRSDTTVEAEVEVRLKTGNVDEIYFRALLATGSRWLSLGSSSGRLSSAGAVAPMAVMANGEGLSDTAATGPIRSSITVLSEVNVTLRLGDRVFANGTEVQTIDVYLTIIALPYINESHVAITGSSGRAVMLGESVDAGDRLMVAVKAFDTDGLSISRRDLPLTVEVRGKLNKVHSAPLQLSSAYADQNVYEATIPENWLKEPETVENGVLPSHAAATACLRSLALHACILFSDLARCFGGVL
jgi:hypothetical protein